MAARSSSRTSRRNSSRTHVLTARGCSSVKFCIIEIPSPKGDRCVIRDLVLRGPSLEGEGVLQMAPQAGEGERLGQRAASIDESKTSRGVGMVCVSCLYGTKPAF